MSLFSQSGQPPIKQLEENHGYLTRDKVKFEECINVYEDRKQRLENAIAITNDEIEHMCRCSCHVIHSLRLLISYSHSSKDH